MEGLEKERLKICLSQEDVNILIEVRSLNHPLAAAERQNHNARRSKYLLICF
jgi:hypothetical protein